MLMRCVRFQQRERKCPEDVATQVCVCACAVCRVVQFGIWSRVQVCGLSRFKYTPKSAVCERVCRALSPFFRTLGSKEH